MKKSTLALLIGTSIAGLTVSLYTQADDNVTVNRIYPCSDESAQYYYVCDDGDTVVILGANGEKGDKGDKGDDGMRAKEFNDSQSSQDYRIDNNQGRITAAAKKQNGVNDYRKAYSENTRYMAYNNESDIQSNTQRISNVAESGKLSRNAIAVAAKNYIDTTNVAQDDLFNSSQLAQDEAIKSAHDAIDGQIQRQNKINNDSQAYAINTNSLANGNSSRINFIESDIYSIKKDIKQLNKGVAMAAAMGVGAGLQTLRHDGRWSITPSIATYEREVALALVGEIAVTDSTSIRIAYSNDAQKLMNYQKGIIAGAVTFSW